MIASGHACIRGTETFILAKQCALGSKADRDGIPSIESAHYTQRDGGNDAAYLSTCSGQRHGALSRRLHPLAGCGLRRRDTHTGQRRVLCGMHLLASLTAPALLPTTVRAGNGAPDPSAPRPVLI